MQTTRLPEFLVPGGSLCLRTASFSEADPYRDFCAMTAINKTFSGEGAALPGHGVPRHKGEVGHQDVDNISFTRQLHVDDQR